MKARCYVHYAPRTPPPELVRSRYQALSFNAPSVVQGRGAASQLSKGGGGDLSLHRSLMAKNSPCVPTHLGPGTPMTDRSRHTSGEKDMTRYSLGRAGARGQLSRNATASHELLCQLSREACPRSPSQQEGS